MAQHREEQQPQINLDYVLRTLPSSNESVSRVNAFFQGWEYEKNPKLDLGLPGVKLDPEFLSALPMDIQEEVSNTFESFLKYLLFTVFSLL